MLVHKFTLALDNTEIFGVVDTTRPEPPTGTIVAVAGDTQVSFSGIVASVSTDVIGYNVYYSAGGGPRTKHNSQLLSFASLTQYTATGLTNDVQHSFTFTSVDGAGNESLDSDAVIATPFVSNIDTTPPAPPVVLGTPPYEAVSGEEAVTVTGMGPSVDTDVIGYRAYYNSGSGALQHNTSLLSVQDLADYMFDGLTNIVTHSFYFTAVDASGNESSPSESIVATPLEPTTNDGLYDPIYDQIYA